VLKRSFVKVVGTSQAVGMQSYLQAIELGEFARGNQAEPHLMAATEGCKRNLF
jgi:hypothetical protein